MPDMLVKLYELPPLEPLLEQQRAQGVEIRRALAPEKRLVLAWIEQHWSPAWASECDVAFANQPPSCFVAVEQQRLVGFACYDATARGFFGPIGVLDAMRGRGVGAALLVATLQAMRWLGYGYAIIGGIGPADFYARTVGATLIPDSAPGIYRGMLRA